MFIKRKYIKNLINNHLSQINGFILFACIINIILGFVLLTYIISFYSNFSNNSYREYGNNERIDDKSSYYLVIEYKIVEGECQPLNMFNKGKTIDAVMKMTNQRINENLGENLTILISLIEYDAVLESFDKISSNLFFLEWSKLVCNYLLQLLVRIAFPSHCDEQCQLIILDSFSSNQYIFTNLSIYPLKFEIPDKNSIVYYINNVHLFQTIKYYEKIVFIQSIIDNSYMSISMLDSNHFQICLTKKVEERSLFVVKEGLDTSDITSIYLSFLSYKYNNYYLRHQKGTLILDQFDQSILFRQDSTFKSIANSQTDLFVFQTINLPDYVYPAVNQQNYSDLILKYSPIPITTNQPDQTFIFRILPATVVF